MNVLHKIGNQIYNFATIAQINLEAYDRSRSQRDQASQCVEIMWASGHVRYTTGEQARQLRAHLEGAPVAERIYRLPGLELVGLVLPEPPAPKPEAPSPEAWRAMCAAVECQAAYNAWAIPGSPRMILTAMSDVLTVHGWQGGTANDAHAFVRRMTSYAYSLIPRIPVPKEGTAP